MEASSQTITISVMAGIKNVRMVHFRCPKNILIRDSLYFKRNLKNDVLSITLPFPDKFNAFPSLLKYLHTGELMLDHEGKYLFVLDLAYHLEMSCLLHKCKTKLKHFTIHQLRHVLRISSDVIQNDDFVDAIKEELAYRLEDCRNYEAFFHFKYYQMLNLIVFSDLNLKLIDKKLPYFIELYFRQREKQFNERFELQQIQIVKNILKNLQILHKLTSELKSSIKEPDPDIKVSPYWIAKQLKEMFYEQLHKEKDLEFFEFEYHTFLHGQPKKRSQSVIDTSSTNLKKFPLKARSKSTIETTSESSDSQIFKSNTLFVPNELISGSSNSLLISSQSSLPLNSDENLAINPIEISKSKSASNIFQQNPIPKPEQSKPLIRKARIVQILH